MTPPFPPRCGRDFEPVRELASGGYGAVWLARQTALERPAVVKMLDAHVLDDADAVERFTDEARITAALAHPSVRPDRAPSSGATTARSPAWRARCSISPRTSRRPTHSAIVHGTPADVSVRLAGHAVLRASALLACAPDARPSEAMLAILLLCAPRDPAETRGAARDEAKKMWRLWRTLYLHAGEWYAKDRRPRAPRSGAG